MSDDLARNILRHRVLDEIGRVDGYIALAEKLDGTEAKEQLRLAHRHQRESALNDATDFIIKNESHLLNQFANGAEVDPTRIEPVITPVRTQGEADLFRYASLQWSVPVSSGYGRRSRFLVTDRYNGKLMAIFALGDPVIAQGARDKVIGWTLEQRNNRLYNVYDAFVLGAVEPYRQLLAGKLVALLTLANETREFLYRKYAGNTTGIRQEVKDPTPALITTSSALGRSSIYNRLTFNGNLMFQSVGFTKGYGHFQFSNELFEELKAFVKDEADADNDLSSRVQSSKYGSGPNWRFRVIRSALAMLDIDTNLLQHNIKREVFLAPAASNWDAYLRGETDELRTLDLPAAEIGSYYRDRWAISRGERYPGYQLWKKEGTALVGELQVRARQLSFDDDYNFRPGEIRMGQYIVRVGTGEEAIRGESIAGMVQDGSVYLSQLVGPAISMTMADIVWRNGEREIRGWSRHNSDERLEQVVNRLRMGIYKSDRFERMSVADLRVPAPKALATSRATARRVSASQLSEILGFDFTAGMDLFGESVVGTREGLLGDDGRRRMDLCIVFPSTSLEVPAVVWALLRPIALARLAGIDITAPQAPREQFRAPPRSLNTTEP